MAKVQAVWNEELGKFEFPTPETKKSESTTVYDPTIARLPVDRAKIDEICRVAGFVPNKGTEKGDNIQKATFATAFIGKAIDAMLAKYPKAGEKTEGDGDVVEEPAVEEPVVEEPASGRKGRKNN